MFRAQEAVQYYQKSSGTPAAPKTAKRKGGGGSGYQRAKGGLPLEHGCTCCSRRGRGRLFVTPAQPSGGSKEGGGEGKKS